MQLPAVDNSALTPQALASPKALGAGASFAGMLGERMEASQADAQEAELRDTARQFIGLAFYFPMLQQMRQDPFRTELFHGGFAEDAFANQMDQTLADAMSSRDSSGLVDAIVRHYAGEASHG